MTNWKLTPKIKKKANERREVVYCRSIFNTSNSTHRRKHGRQSRVPR